MRFCLLGSGSRGNATLVERGETRILLDSGFSLKELERRLARAGMTASQLSAVVVTHEHNDHVGGIGPLARKYRLPVLMSAGTWRGCRQRIGEIPHLELIGSHDSFTLQELLLHPYTVPHDACEPCQFIFDDGARRLGILTDSGSITPHIEQSLERCDALVLECNHDPQMLRDGPYPPALQARVGGALGHLSNGQAAGLLGRIDTGRLQHLIAAHLSEKNNTPTLAAAALSTVLGCEEGWIGLADQEEGLPWREIG